MITKQTLKNIVIKSNKISKMANEVARNKYSELKKCKGNIETRMEALQGLKYKVQTIMTEKNEEASDIDAYAEQLEERISQFDAVISSLERAIQLLADSEEAKSGAERIKSKRWNS